MIVALAIAAMRGWIVAAFTKTSENPEIQAIYDASRAMLAVLAEPIGSSFSTSHDLVSRIAREFPWSDAQGALIYLVDKGMLRIDSKQHVTLSPLRWS